MILKPLTFGVIYQPGTDNWNQYQSTDGRIWIWQEEGRKETRTSKIMDTFTIEWLRYEKTEFGSNIVW